MHYEYATRTDIFSAVSCINWYNNNYIIHNIIENIIYIKLVTSQNTSHKNYTMVHWSLVHNSYLRKIFWIRRPQYWNITIFGGHSKNSAHQGGSSSVSKAESLKTPRTNKSRSSKINFVLFLCFRFTLNAAGREVVYTDIYVGTRVVWRVALFISTQPAGSWDVIFACLNQILFYVLLSRSTYKTIPRNAYYDSCFL